MDRKSELTIPLLVKGSETEKDRSQGSKRRNESDAEPHSINPKRKDMLPHPGKWRRIPCNEARRLLFQQQVKEKERLLVKQVEKEMGVTMKEWESVAAGIDEEIAHARMLSQLEREADEDEEIYDQIARIYDFEFDQCLDFEAAARYAPAARGNGARDSGLAFGPYIKGTHHVRMHDHNLVMNASIASKNNVHDNEHDVIMKNKAEHVIRKRRGTVSVSERVLKVPQGKRNGFILEFPNCEFDLPAEFQKGTSSVPAVPQNRISLVPAVPGSAFRKAQNKKCGFILVFAGHSGIELDSAATVPPNRNPSVSAMRQKKCGSMSNSAVSRKKDRQKNQNHGCCGAEPQKVRCQNVVFGICER